MGKPIKLNMKWTKKLPTREGYYWWKNIQDPDVVAILLVSKAEVNDDVHFYAANEEYSFKVLANPFERWCYIPKPK